MNSTPQAQPKSGTSYLSIAQFIVSLLGILSSLLMAGAIAVIAIIGLFSETAGPDEATTLFSTVWVSLVTAALALPSLVLSFMRIWNWPFEARQIKTFRLASILLLVWPLVLLLGKLISQSNTLAWLLLPPLGLLAIGLPILWIIEFLRRKISAGSPQRTWGLVSFTVFISTPTLMIVEILGLLMLGLAFAIWIASQPELTVMLQRLIARLSIGQPDTESVIKTLSPYLQKPEVIFSLLAVIGGLVPLIEELLKPLALWALADRKLTPSQGFVSGAICGGAFALVESLLYLSNPLGDTWASMAAGRAGTALLHIAASGMVGWGMASAWRNGSYLRLGGAYLAACALHGLWNSLSILTGLSSLTGDLASPNLLTVLSKVAPFGLAFLALALVGILWWGSRNFEPPAPTSVIETRS